MKKEIPLAQGISAIRPSDCTFKRFSTLIGPVPKIKVTYTIQRYKSAYLEEDFAPYLSINRFNPLFSLN